MSGNSKQTAPEYRKPSGSANMRAAYLTTADFTAPGLFTDWELRSLDKGRRKITIGNPQCPATAAATYFPDSYGANGITTEYSCAGTETGPYAQTLEAQIYTPKLPGDPGTIYSLTLSWLNHAQTVQTVSIVTRRSPDNADRFNIDSAYIFKPGLLNRLVGIVSFPAAEFVMPSSCDIRPGPKLLEQFRENSGFITETYRQFSENPDITKTTRHTLRPVAQLNN